MPTATLASDEFFGLARAEAGRWGLPGLPIVVLPHPIARRDDDECRSFSDAAAPEIVAAWRRDPRELEEYYRRKTIESAARRYRSVFQSDFNDPEAPDIIHAPESFDAIQRVFHQRGWTDGLPVVPPTLERCAEMLGGVDPGELIGIVEPRLGRGNAARIAANAVMAGCEPAHFPVVLAAVRAMCAAPFNLRALQSTTHPCTVLCLIGGPIVEQIGVNGAYNAMGQGRRANAAIGRAIRLILTNVGGAAPGVLDRSTMGSPAKYSFCFAENAEASPWESYHREQGLDPRASWVTVFGVEGPHNVNDHYGRTGEEILRTVAGTLASPGANNFYLLGDPIVVLGPEHAEVIARDGFSKDDVRRFLSEHAIIPRTAVSDALIDELERRCPDHLLGERGREGIRFITRPENIVVLVAGGAGRHSAILPSFGESTRAVSERIR